MNKRKKALEFADNGIHGNDNKTAPTRRSRRTGIVKKMEPNSDTDEEIDFVDEMPGPSSRGAPAKRSRPHAQVVPQVVPQQVTHPQPVRDDDALRQQEEDDLMRAIELSRLEMEAQEKRRSSPDLSYHSNSLDDHPPFCRKPSLTTLQASGSSKADSLADGKELANVASLTPTSGVNSDSQSLLGKDDSSDGEDVNEWQDAMETNDWGDLSQGEMVRSSTTTPTIEQAGSSQPKRNTIRKLEQQRGSDDEEEIPGSREPTEGSQASQEPPKGSQGSKEPSKGSQSHGNVAQFKTGSSPCNDVTPRKRLCLRKRSLGLKDSSRNSRSSTKKVPSPPLSSSLDQLDVEDLDVEDVDVEDVDVEDVEVRNCDVGDGKLPAVDAESPGSQSPGNQRGTEADGKVLQLVDSRKQTLPKDWYYAPPNVQKSSYTKVIMQLIQAYFTRLQRAQKKSSTVLDWGDQVVSGNCFSDALLHRRRGNKSSRFFADSDDDSDDEEDEAKAGANEPSPAGVPLKRKRIKQQRDESEDEFAIDPELEDRKSETKRRVEQRGSASPAWLSTLSETLVQSQTEPRDSGEGEKEEAGEIQYESDVSEPVVRGPSPRENSCDSSQETVKDALGDEPLRPSPVPDSQDSGCDDASSPDNTPDNILSGEKSAASSVTVPYLGTDASRHAGGGASKGTRTASLSKNLSATEVHGQAVRDDVPKEIPKKEDSESDAASSEISFEERRYSFYQRQSKTSAKDKPKTPRLSKQTRELSSCDVGEHSGAKKRSTLKPGGSTKMKNLDEENRSMSRVKKFKTKLSSSYHRVESSGEEDGVETELGYRVPPDDEATGSTRDDRSRDEEKHRPDTSPEQEGKDSDDDYHETTEAGELHDPDSNPEDLRQDLEEEELNDNQDDGDATDATQGTSKIVQEEEKEIGVDCPLCGIAFPNDKIEGHASGCNGLPTPTPEEDEPHNSATPGPSGSQQRQYSDELTTSPTDNGQADIFRHQSKRTRQTPDPFRGIAAKVFPESASKKRGGHLLRRSFVDKTRQRPALFTEDDSSESHSESTDALSAAILQLVEDKSIRLCDRKRTRVQGPPSKRQKTTSSIADRGSDEDASVEPTELCFLCQKQIPKSSYATHVTQEIEESDAAKTRPSLRSKTKEPAEGGPSSKAQTSNQENATPVDGELDLDAESSPSSPEPLFDPTISDSPIRAYKSISRQPTNLINFKEQFAKGRTPRGGASSSGSTRAGRGQRKKGGGTRKRWRKGGGGYKSKK